MGATEGEERSNLAKWRLSLLKYVRKEKKEVEARKEKSKKLEDKDINDQVNKKKKTVVMYAG